MSADRRRPVLVTGAAGLLGRALSQRLVDRGRAVRCLDVEDADGLPSAVERVRADVRDAEEVDRQVRECGTVLHLAAIVGVPTYLARPADVLDVNHGGTRAVLDACLRHGRPVLVASTSEVYGRNTEDLHEASEAVYGPPSASRWCYAISKAAGEHHAFARGAEGLAFAIVRYFNVYGPKLEPPGRERVISRFVRALRADEPLPLVGGGRAVRSFCFVDDAADATLAVVRSLEEGGTVVGRAINVGRREPVTIRELAERVVALADHGAGTVEVAGREHFGEGFEEVLRRVPDLSALRALTGFEAPTSLDEGLRRVLSHHALLRRPDAVVEAPPVRMVRPSLDPDRRLLSTVDATLRSGFVTNGGPLVRELERSCARTLGVAEAVAVSSGSMALLLAAHALGRTGKVVLPSFTYIATLSAFVHRGLEPVFCDIDPDTWTMDPACLEAILAREPDVAVIAPVNVYGVAPDLAEIAALARRHDAALVYDNAHGFGSEVAGARCPAEPDVQTFSLHATKTLPAIEGGLVVGADAPLLAEVRRLANHGLTTPLVDSGPGYNAKLDEIRAAVGLHSLATFEDVLTQRRRDLARLSAFATDRCAGAVVPQRIPGEQRTSAQNLGVRCAGARERGLETIIEAFAARGVEARRYFHPPLHWLDGWRGRFELPVTDRLAAELVCLPIHSRMRDEDLARVEAAMEAVAAEPTP